MAYKEHEGIEEEMNMPDTEAPEGGTHTTGAGSGEEVAEVKPEQQIPIDEEAKCEADPSEADHKKGMPEEKSEQQISYAEKNGGDVHSSDTGGEIKPKFIVKGDILKILLALAQIAASIATVVTASLAWSTLQEMQIERNNAYRPEIVVSPNTFEGGAVKTDEDTTNGAYMNIYYKTDYPFDGYIKGPFDNPECLYLKTPYLTLKNIGQGTAKDVQVIFSVDWIESVAAELSNIDNCEYFVTCEELPEGRHSVLLWYANPNLGKIYHLCDEEDMVKKITYIASDEDSVNVAFPESWIKILGVLYGRTIRRDINLDSETVTVFSSNIDIPDPVIRIEYSDMQGNMIEDEILIPWTGYYVYLVQNHNGNLEISALVKTGFFEDYIE